MSDEPELPEYPGHTAAFGRIMRLWGSDQGRVRDMESQLDDVMKVSDEELVLLTALHIRDVGQDAEVARRTVAALIAFKKAAATASSRLETLTRWLIAFTVVLAFLTVVVVVHDLTR